MFKDIRIFRGKSSVSYIFNSKNGLIEFETDNLNIDTAKDLKIIYDENIYDIIIDEKNIKDNSNKGEIIINLGISQKIKFNVKVNYKYFIKTV